MSSLRHFALSRNFDFLLFRFPVYIVHLFTDKGENEMNSKLFVKSVSLLTLLLPAITGNFARAAAPLKKQAAAPAGIILKNQPNSGAVNFLAVGKPSMLKIHGTAKGPVADLSLAGAQLKGSITFELDKLDTGIDLRTHHMKEKYLQVKDYPQAKLTLVDAPVDSAFANNLTNGGDNKFQGSLALHGKVHDISGTFTAKDGLVLAKFPLTLSDYAIDVPKYLGITVAKTVDVDVELPLRKE